jgi:hypothetical protein
MCDLGNRDSAASLLALLVLTCRQSQRASSHAEEMLRTRVFELQSHIEDGDDLTLALAHVYVAIHADNLVDLRCNAILFGRDGSELSLEIVFGPRRDVLVDPVPVVGVV